MKTVNCLMLTLLALFLISCAGLPMGPNAQSEFEKGLALYNDGQYENALPYFKKATEIDQEFARAYMYMGRSYLNLEKWADAIPPLWKAFRMSPEETTKEIGNDLFKAFFGKALSEFKKGNYQGAIDDLREGLKLKPQSAEATRELGRTLIAFGTQLLSDGKIMEALSSFKEAVKVLPDNLEAYLGLARAFFKDGEFMEALDTVRKALKIDPGSDDARSMLLELFRQK